MTALRRSCSPAPPPRAARVAAGRPIRMGPGGRARSIGNRMTSLIAARDPVRRGLNSRAPLLLLVAVPRLRHHGLRFDAPHRDCRDRLSGQRLILLLVEHGHRPLRAFTIHKVLEAPRRSAGLRAVPPCSVQFGGVAAMRRAFLVKPKRQSTPLWRHQCLSCSRANPASARNRMRTRDQRAQM